MAKEISTTILINARPEKVWKALTHFEAYPTWNPFILSIRGELTAGKKIEAYLKPPGAKGMRFTPKLVEVRPNKRLTWLGHLLFPGIFDGEHTFELNENPDGTTTFIQREKFGGILVPLMKKMLDNNTVNGFNEMNRALKARVEKEEAEH